MKILVVCQHYYPEPFRVTGICESLVVRGHDVTVLTAIPNYPAGVFYDGYSKKERREETLNGVKVIRCYAHPRGKKLTHRFLNYLSFPHNGKKAAKKLDDDFDVVFVYQLSPIMMAEPGLYYGKRNNVKVLLYELDPWPSNLTAGGIKDSSLIYRHFARLSRKIYKEADYVFVSSKPHISYIESLCGCSLPISYLPQYAVDEGEFSLKQDDEFHFLYAGNVGQALPIEIMLRSFKEAIKKNPAIHLDVAGDGSAFLEAVEFCKENKISNIYFHGWLNKEEFAKIASRCKAAIVLLNHQFYSQSTVPGKVQTYLKLGFPILAADNGATKQILEESASGICVPTSDEEALTNAIIKMSRLDDASLNQFSLNGKKYYQENMTEELFFQTLLSKLEELAKKR